MNYTFEALLVNQHLNEMPLPESFVICHCYEIEKEKKRLCVVCIFTVVERKNVLNGKTE